MKVVVFELYVTLLCFASAYQRYTDFIIERDIAEAQDCGFSVPLTFSLWGLITIRLFQFLEWGTFSLV